MDKNWVGLVLLRNCWFLIFWFIYFLEFKVGLVEMQSVWWNSSMSWEFQELLVWVSDTNFQSCSYKNTNFNIFFLFSFIWPRNYQNLKVESGTKFLLFFYFLFFNVFALCVFVGCFLDLVGFCVKFFSFRVH